ncbi:MAG: DUF1016 N-terminal domain-containing protein, partial [Patescibacteria group bacterium]
MDDKSIIKNDYLRVLNSLKEKIKKSQQKAIISANREMLQLYWDIGNAIIEQQNKKGWGSKIIDNLSRDLSSSFPDMKGFSKRNLKYMRKFAEHYPDFSIVQEPLAQLTWYHNITLMEKIG